jgi:hypothetical protein
MRYRIIFHRGEEIALRTEFDPGFLCLTEDGFRIETQENAFEVPYSTIRKAALFRLLGLGRMIRIDLDSSRLYLTVVRFNIGRLFAVVNYFGTGELCRKVEERLS